LGVAPTPPVDPELAEHFDQTGIVVDCRATMVLSELRRNVPAQRSRPGAEVAALATRPLAEPETDIRRVAPPPGFVAIIVGWMRGNTCAPRTTCSL
jgi:hypothetical protein